MTAGRLALSVVVISAAGLAQADEIDEAKAQFVKSCGVCHATEEGAAARQGPNLRGVFGAKAANVPGFKYSAAMASADWLWTAEKLDPWIANASAVLPGTTMNYRQTDAERRKKIIVYLKSIGTGQ